MHVQVAKRAGLHDHVAAQQIGHAHVHVHVSDARDGWRPLQRPATYHHVVERRAPGEQVVVERAGLDGDVAGGEVLLETVEDEPPRRRRLKDQEEQDHDRHGGGQDHREDTDEPSHAPPNAQLTPESASLGPG